MCECYSCLLKVHSDVCMLWMCIEGTFRCTQVTHAYWRCIQMCKCCTFVLKAHSDVQMLCMCIEGAFRWCRLYIRIEGTYRCTNVMHVFWRSIQMYASYACILKVHSNVRMWCMHKWKIYTLVIFPLLLTLGPWPAHGNVTLLYLTLPFFCMLSILTIVFKQCL